MHITVIDIVFLFLFVIIVIRAGLRGFIEELTGLGWLILGLLFSVSFYHEGAAYIRTKILHDSAYLPEVIAFFSLFLITFIIIKIIGSMLKEIVERTGLVFVDRILGVLFGVFKGIVIIAVIIFIIDVQPLFNGDRLLSDSVIARFLTPNRAIIEKTLEFYDV